MCDGIVENADSFCQHITFVFFTPGISIISSLVLFAFHLYHILMLQSYHMVIYNLLFSILLLVGVGLYRFVVPKKKIPGLVFVILFSVLPILSIFRNGTYESGDLSVNAVKTMEFYLSLMEGHIIPRWAGNLNALYGYPLFIYTYPLPYYLAALFHFIGFGFIDSIKCLLIVSFVFSGITMYLFLQDVLGEIPAVVGSIFYLFAPYHLVDMHFRVDIGETLSFVFLPLIFWGIRRQMFEAKLRWQLLTVLSVSGLLLSHQAVSLFFLPLAVVYLLLLHFLHTKKSWRKFLFVLGSMIWGGLLDGFYIFPVLWESSITMQSHVASVYFFPIWDYLFSPYRFGFLFQGHQGELSFLVGYTQFFIVGFCLYLSLRQRVEKKYQLFFRFSLLSFFALFVFMQWFTAPLWNVLPFVKNFQFSYRLMVGIVFFTSILAGFSVRNIKQKRWIVLLCFLTVFSTILNWGNRRVIPEITDAVLAKSLPESTYRAEGLFPALPEWVDRNHPWMTMRPPRPMIVVSGKAIVQPVSRTSTRHSYIVSAESKTTLRENTLYYPGWKVFVDGKVVPITYRYKQYPGIIRFQVEKGMHFVRVVFTETADRIAGELISLGAFVLFLFYIVIQL